MKPHFKAKRFSQWTQPNEKTFDTVLEVIMVIMQGCGSCDAGSNPVKHTN